MMTKTTCRHCFIPQVWYRVDGTYHITACLYCGRVIGQEKHLGKPSMKNEQYLAITGRHMGKYWCGFGRWKASGTPSRVGFDQDLVIKREEQHGDILGYYHTHPSFFATPSDTDLATMRAWVACFGKPLICMINGIDGLKAHWFLDDESDYITTWAQKYGNIFVGKVPVEVRSLNASKVKA